MSLLTHQLERLELVAQSQATKQEKEQLSKAITKEIEWTPELRDLMERLIQESD